MATNAKDWRLLRRRVRGEVARPQYNRRATDRPPEHGPATWRPLGRVLMVYAAALAAALAVMLVI